MRDLVVLRAAIKAAPINPAPQRDPAPQRAETVRKSILEEIQRRKETYVRGLDLARRFGGLRVSVNAHLVYGHKGTLFARTFFYLNGELTALQTIIAIADTLKRETAQKAS